MLTLVWSRGIYEIYMKLYSVRYTLYTILYSVYYTVCWPQSGPSAFPKEVQFIAHCKRTLEGAYKLDTIVQFITK